MKLLRGCMDATVRPNAGANLGSNECSRVDRPLLTNIGQLPNRYIGIGIGQLPIHIFHTFAEVLGSIDEEGLARGKY